ncbi:Zinc finger protein 362 [Schistosoma japonicum]|nr:Zinc finger protein 362 [Schistosoma japonicum]
MNCATCMKSFTQMSNLQSHQRQHMKGKPYRCEQCFMSFDTKEELDVHVQAKHSGNRYAKKEKRTAKTSGRGNVIESGSHIITGGSRHSHVNSAVGVGGGLHSSHSSHPGASAASAAAAAAVAAAHAHQDLHLRAVAAAAVASSNGIGVGNRTDIDSQCAFFNAATCSTETRVTSPNGCDLLHNNNALNYSSMSSGTGLFHHLPVGEGGVHASSAEHLATSVVQQQQQQQQQQCITPHRHQQGTHFTDDSQHLNAFNHSNISPNHHSQSQQQQQYNHHHQQHQHHQQPQHIQRNVHSSSSKRHSTMKSSPPQSTHRYSESPVTNDSQNQQQQQQHLLNLTQHHLTNPKQSSNPQHHHQQQPHHQNQRVGLSSQTHPNQAFLHNHINNFSSAPTSPDMMMSSNGLSTAPSLSDNNSSLSTFEGFRQTIKPTSEDCPKWHSKDNKSLFGNTNGSLFNRDQVCRSSVSPASLSPKSGQGIAAVEAITTRSCNGSIHNGTPLSSSSSPVNNPIIIDNNGNSMNLKQGQYTHQLTSSNNNTEFNGSILNDRRQSTDLRIGTNDKYMSDKLKPIDMKHLFLSNDHVSDNNNHSNLNNDTNTATTSENLELNNNNTDVYPSTTSLTNRSLKHSLTNDHHSMKNMIENNHEADDDELLTKSHFHHHKRQVIMSDSNNEKNTVSPTECNIDDADTSDGDHVESNYLVNNKIDHRNNNDETIDIDNDPQTSNETPFYLGQKTQQEQQNHPNEQHQMNSSTTSSSPSSLSSTVAEKHYSDTLNSSKRRRRHQYVPQHLPVFDFNTKDMSDRRKNNSTVNNNNMYSTTTDYCINRRSKNNVAILENGENKCLKSGRIVGKSDSLDDEIISSDNFDKNENNNNNPTMNDNNSRECYFSAF